MRLERREVTKAAGLVIVGQCPSGVKAPGGSFSNSAPCRLIKTGTRTEVTSRDATDNTVSFPKQTPRSRKKNTLTHSKHTAKATEHEKRKCYKGTEVQGTQIQQKYKPRHSLCKQIHMHRPRRTCTTIQSYTCTQFHIAMPPCFAWEWLQRYWPLPFISDPVTKLTVQPSPLNNTGPNKLWLSFL